MTALKHQHTARMRIVSATAVLSALKRSSIKAAVIQNVNTAIHCVCAAQLRSASQEADVLHISGATDASTAGFKMAALSVKPAQSRIQPALKPRLARLARVDMSTIGASLIIADIEQIAGVRTAIVIESVAHVTRGDFGYILKSCFIKRFSWVAHTFELEAKTAFDVINLFSRTRDLDLLIDYMKSVYDITHFPLTRRLFSTFSKFILYNWYFISKHHDGVGFYMIMSGKLSKQLLTRGQTVRLRLGKTSFGIVKNNLIFRYRQTHSETGAYGLSIYYFTRSILYNNTQLDK